MATTVRTPAANAAKRTPMTSKQEDSARRGRLLPGHLHLDPHPRPLPPGAEPPGLDHQLRRPPGVLVGGFLEVIVAVAGIGTAVTLYPAVKRQNEGLALGFVTARVVEAVMIFTGVVSLLSLVTLRQDLGGAAGTNAAALVATGASHVAIYKWTFLLSQSLMPAINALLLGSLMYRSRLVPRIIPVIGLIGAPFLICTVIATLFGAMKLGSVELAAVPVAAWELSLGAWLLVKGFRPSPITAEVDAASTPPAYQDITV